MGTPSPEVQAHNLAEICAGVVHTFCEQQLAPQMLEGTTTFKRMGVTTFQMTTQSGTVLEFSVKVVADGN